MKKSNKRGLSGLVLAGLMITSQAGYAGLGEKFNKYIGSEFTNVSGFYIILGVISVGIIGKLCQIFFIHEEDKPAVKVKLSQHSHHRHHKAKPMIKKTS